VPLHHPADGPPPRAGEDLVLANPLTIDLAGFDGIIVSPGVPINRHPIAAAARAAGVPLIGDIELFALARPYLPPHKVVGITGTNGKSTTTALVHHILKTAGVPTTMGGNIGIPILSQPALPEGGVYVLELSSYQIDLTFSLDCDAAVLLNITPDHLDRYDSFLHYAAAKFRLFMMQTSGHASIIPVFRGRPFIDEFARRFRERANERPFAQLQLFQRTDTEDEVLILPGRYWPAMTYQLAEQARSDTLDGDHNLDNAVCAMAACRALGLAWEPIFDALGTYPGLPHRMERIAEIDGVLYVNDSKATNAASAAPALAAYPPAPHPRIHWIVGGLAKTDGVGECEPLLGNVAHAWLIGDAAPMLERTLAGRVPLTVSGTMDAAVAAAHAAAQAGDVVLLSPAAASFDQFRDFEHRGDHFRALVTSLANGEGQP
jgi:UDP-N-acetylmuramoylalanine--D-glutamate ligase